MPRISQRRKAAVPTSAEQRARHQRILRAAARLGAKHGAERMQMTDVAREANVAIATLYRYFPSKTDLFVGVLGEQIATMRRVDLQLHGLAPSQAVAETLVISSRRLRQHPRLAMAMLQANNTAHVGIGQGGSEVGASFRELLRGALGVAQPGADDDRMLRLVEQAWFGILVSLLNDVITPEESEADLRLTCALLLGPAYDG